ncbi:MAG: hypothetical protein ACRDTF_23945 [Pseudonocardiaceae bacterium]
MPDEQPEFDRQWRAVLAQAAETLSLDAASPIRQVRWRQERSACLRWHRGCPARSQS